MREESMKSPFLMVALAFVCLAGTVREEAWAQEAPVAVNPPTHELAEEPAPSVPSGAGEPATAEGLTEQEKQEKLRLMINLELIDLDRLRQAVEQHGPQETLPLSLEQAVHIALEQNQDIEVVLYEPMKATGDIMSARGEFDPALSGKTTYIQAAQSVASDVRTFGGVSAIKTYRTQGQVAVGGKLVTGTQYQLAFNSNKEETTFNDFIEEWEGNVTLSLTQPLLRGFGIGVNRTRILVAQNSREASLEQVRSTVMSTVSEVIRAYWDLVGGVETMRVREESLANAERLLQINQRRFEIGSAAAIEVLQSKAGVAGRQSDLIAARSSVADREDVLKRLLFLREDEGFSNVRINPLDRPSVAQVDWEQVADFAPAVEESLERALEYRPELQMARLEIESADLQRRRARNDMLPQLDIGGTASSGGRDHYVRNMLTGIGDRADHSYSVTIQGNIPIGNRAARGAYHRTEMDLRQAEQRFQQRVQEIELDVRLAARNAITSKILVESNRQARVLQEANVIAEEKRLQLGVTTSYRVLEVQEDLTAAQTQEVQALVNYQKALTDLLLAEGTILETYDLEVETPESTPIGYFESLWPF
jgi:outer membrane protein TolC